MSKLAINKLTNANVYLDGANLLGRATEVTLPVPTMKMVEHAALGMVGTLEVPAGGWEAMEAKFKWASYYREVMRKTADPRKGVQVQLRASLEVFTGQGLTDEIPVVVTMGGFFKQASLGQFKQHEAVEPENTLAVHYLKVVIDGETIIELDVINNVHRTGQVDALARFRALIGG